MLYETRFLQSLALTLAIEVPAVFLLIRYFLKRKAKNLDVLFVTALASLLTLPYFWFVLPPYVNSRYYIWIGEAFAVSVEAIVFNRLLKLRMFHAILVSTAANMLSFVLGLIVL